MMTLTVTLVSHGLHIHPPMSLTTRAQSCDFNINIMAGVVGILLAYRRLTEHPNPVPIALFLGFAFPPMMGNLWGDPKGAFIWAGLVSRLASMRVHFPSPAISDGRHISLALHFSGQLVSIQWA